MVAPEAAGPVVEDRFAIVPEWLLDADVSDTAIRLYAVLLRYGQTSGARMPGRATLARRLHKRSTDSVDRAMRELVEIGAVHVQHRYSSGLRLTNLYQLKAVRGTQRSGEPAPDAGRVTALVEQGGSRKFAATLTDPDLAASVSSEGGGRMNAAQPKAPHPDNNLLLPAGRGCPRRRGEPLGEEEDPSLNSVGITDMDAYVSEVQALRAADPATRSPMRLAEAGPWWDLTIATSPIDPSETGAGSESTPLEVAEAELAEADGLRVVLQRQAREQLAAKGAPVTRVTVLRRAHQLLLQKRDRQEVPA
ncbi:MAG: hypothetical protein QOE76_2496 [Frankiales bacterium]|jgi:hypothetical protein|nr:hypothetical protein [Frankiales bacterium]